VSTETPAPGGDLQYRLTVAPQGDVDARGVTVRVQLPATGTVDPASATGGLELAPATGERVWRGRVGAGQTHALAWTVNVPDDVLVGARLIARASLTADGVPRTSLWRAVRVRSTDFSGSGLTADHSVAAEGDVVRFRIQVVNAGPRPSNVELANSLPVALAYVDGSATSSAGAPPVWQALARVVAWSGEVPGRSVVTVRFAAVFDGARQVTNAMWLTDDHGATFADWVTISPATDRLFVPAVTNSADGP
jgi:uncharacterized repeat protein (TIGR01451 family)